MSYISIKLLELKGYKEKFKLSKTIKFGILSDLIALFVMFAFNTVYKMIEDSSFVSTDYFLTDFLSQLYYFTMYPDYNSITLYGDFSTGVPIVIAIILSCLLCAVLNYCFVLRKTELKTKDKIDSLLILSLITAPYYFFISLGFLFQV